MLSNRLAQRIVDKVMESIPYNINIMNEKGIIIASGDFSRIGEIHSGALESIKTKDNIEIEKDNYGVKAGVNIPIIFREKIIGVIGITGMPDKVKPFGKLVSITAELLVSQEYSLNEHIIEQKLVEEYLYQWVNRLHDYDENFIQRGIALGIDINLDRIGIVVQYDKDSFKEARAIIKKFINNSEYSVDISYDRTAILISFDKYTDKRIHSLIKKLENFNVKAGVGTFNNKIVISLKEAVCALDLGYKLYVDEFIYTYERMKFLDEISYTLRKMEGNKIIDKIIESGGIDLLETFINYIELNGERSNVAKALHIHRNTLNYRLDKIQEITGLKFNDYKDLMQIIGVYIGYKLKN